jgi:hypothetical protein
MIEATGLLSVKEFGALGNSVNDDAPAVRAALNATTCCGGCVFFPPGVFRLNSTVSIRGCVKGATGSNSGIAQSLATTAGSAQLIGPAQGPALAIIDALDGTLLQDLNIKGSTMVKSLSPPSSIVVQSRQETRLREVMFIYCMYACCLSASYPRISLLILP